MKTHLLPAIWRTTCMPNRPVKSPDSGSGGVTFPDISFSFIFCYSSLTGWRRLRNRAARDKSWRAMPFPLSIPPPPVE
jgi:hypothetical protein